MKAIVHTPEAVAELEAWRDSTAPCGACENACHCEKHGRAVVRDCKAYHPNTFPQSQAAQRREWLADYRHETGASKLEAELAFEHYSGQVLNA